MPITLDKLFSPTAESSFEFLGESVTVVWAPWRWTGEMQEMADKLSAEADEEGEAIADLKAAGDEQGAKQREQAFDLQAKRRIRELLATLLVSWDVLDGRTPVGVDLPTLNKLPDPFLETVLLSLYQESMPDPQKAPNSEKPSDTEQTTGSAPSRNGMNTSSARERSASRRSSSMNGHAAAADIPRGAIGRRSPRPSSRRSPSASSG